MENGKKKGSITSMVISKAGKIAGDYSLKPEPPAPTLIGMNKPLSWLHLRKSSTKTCEPEIKRVNSEKRISFSEEGGGELGKGGGRGGGAIVGGRRSVSHVETNLASVVTFLQVKVMAVDMPGFMQVHAFRCARRTYDSLEKFSSKHVAYNMKKEFDKVYGPAWHCIVGANFGSFVTHLTGCFLYFSMEKLYILLFKTKVQKALD